jgi:dihydrofolate reductase
VIGREGKIPWHVKGDLAFFKRMTLGRTCIVGRKTFNGLPKLANREFVVLSSSGNIEGQNDFTPFNDIKPIIKDGPYWDDWVIGGAEMFRILLPHCTELYLTRLFQSYEGDTYFPSFEHLFVQDEVIERTDEYAIIRYRNKSKDSCF